MVMFSIVILYIVVLLSSVISCRFLIIFSSSQNKPLYYIIYTAINLVISYFILNAELYIPEIINNIMGILIALIFSRFVLKTDFNTALLAGVLIGVIFGMCNIVAFSFDGILLRETQISVYLIIILNSAVILILSAVTLEVFSKRYGKHCKWGGKSSVLYVFPLVFTYFILQVIINMIYNPVEIINDRLHYSTTTMEDIEILFVIIISLVSIYTILYSYEKVMTQIETQNKMSNLEAYTEMQKQYISEAKHKYDNTKEFRHDMNNHMITLAGLIKSNETDKAIEYLKRFDKEVKELSFEVFTGNAVIDILLKEKLGFAKEQGIKVVCDTQIPKDITLDDFDLCIIFFNALDNAIKGCEYTKDSFIDIVAKKNNEFFVIDIMNSFNPVKYEKGSGIGLETIKFITEKYGGYLEISVEKQVFRVSIMFSLK